MEADAVQQEESKRRGDTRRGIQDLDSAAYLLSRDFEVLDIVRGQNGFTALVFENTRAVKQALVDWLNSPERHFLDLNRRVRNVRHDLERLQGVINEEKGRRKQHARRQLGTRFGTDDGDDAAGTDAGGGD